MRISEIEGRFAVARLSSEEAFPQWARGPFVSITRTAGELSIVCEERWIPEGVRLEPGWRCLGIEGPIPFETTGVAASLTSPLAAAGLSVFLVATFDTDYILVKDETFSKAKEALLAAGHEFAPLTR